MKEGQNEWSLQAGGSGMPHLKGMETVVFLWMNHQKLIPGFLVGGSCVSVKHKSEG